MTIVGVEKSNKNNIITSKLICIVIVSDKETDEYYMKEFKRWIVDIKRVNFVTKFSGKSDITEVTFLKQLPGNANPWYTDEEYKTLTINN